ncbi:MAG: beta-propeller domain-containing protein, partial [Bdellovibrionales bacterium]|nr:beta-propeller domain-containing protein [Bdellovibrionales bacterium]
CMSFQRTRSRRHLWTLTVTAVAIASAVGCSRDAGHAPEGGQGLVAKPTGELKIEDLARRFRGQSEFVNPYQNFRNFRLHAGAASPESAARSADAPGAGGGPQRAIQESDVFKVGPKGAKLLYLLNNYRGLQVVSFEKGDLAPELLGRVEATGNYPSEMYYQEDKARLIVIEQIGSMYSSSNNGAEKNGGRLVVYDVSKARDPKIDHVIEFVGSAVDSRMVGNVLYVASGNYSYDQSGNNKSAGYLHAFRMDKAKLELAQTHKLSLAVSARENMNIVEVKEGAGFKYYLVAILSSSGWGWWDRMSQVEVVDMTDPNGAIKPLMTVSAKGFINERSQTSVVGNTLLVTSNYFLDNTAQNPNGTRLTRIAVETFNLPTATSEIISTDEAEYRRLHIERQLGKLAVAARTDEAREALLTDKELGLKGRFVKSDTGLRKLFADNVITVGDTTGLSASLQDTRIDNGLLYAFWVPANMVDPLDLFDVSQPEQGAKYLGRLQFDGWISRAIPMTHQGRRFVIGLGFVNPAVNNETNKRYPQAMIFEIMNIGGKLRSVEVGQLTLKSENTWVDFNSPDKMIEVRPTGDGKGEIMFQVYQWDQVGGSKQGGKIIQFDLNAITSPGAQSPLAEGGLLLGEAGWLKRVFSNSEIQKINAFSDEELATFDTKGLPEISATVSAAHRLELARNIRGFEILGSGADAVGVQIVEKGNAWTGDRKVSVGIRVVSMNNADAEAKDVRTKMQVAGSYVTHLMDKNGGVYILTSESIPDETPAGTPAGPSAVAGIRRGYYTPMKTRTHIGYLVPSKTLSVASLIQTSWDNVQEKSATSDRMGLGWYSPYETARLVMLENGTVLHQVGTQVRILQNAAGALSAQNVSLQTCRTEGRTDLKLQVIAGGLYLSSKLISSDNTREGISFAKNFVSKVALAAGDAACTDEMNIPGELVGVTADHILVSDTSLKDIAKVEYEAPMKNEGTPAVSQRRVRYDLTTQRSLISLKREVGKAVLVDERTLGQNDSLQPLAGALTMVMKNPESSYNQWGGYSAADEDEGVASWYRSADSRPEFKFFDVRSEE